MADPAIIRAARAEDDGGILAIVNDAILNTTAWYDCAPWTKERIAEWRTAKLADGWPLIVAEVANGVAGFGSFGPFRARQAYAGTAEHSVYISNTYRENGYGRQLLEALIELARGRGLHTIVGGVDSENAGSLAFHRALGFEEAGRLREVGRKFDRWLTLVFMQKLL
ncbi:GNAT family N-acetyltransferase [Sphingosinicella microcystinivorans]|uniref:Phosphinothricin acetyltransferase n=1 Tax=Sphingosinicella microcystinivorans TaxID=335406 RepID=A0AAD1D554_SPHMI|nr:GNAT family N-acetyltransferase [Sphingosinicella microcystinivorans]RKS85570.1 phosphinothricin acetyltransferase [Sphingosinicella microcystinivorans]BBE33136.1 phosphinothricin acetyltransferase [Sphingosinicella microcystinivorans]